MERRLDGHGAVSIGRNSEAVSVGRNRSNKQFSCRHFQFACSVTPLVDEVLRVLRLSDGPRGPQQRRPGPVASVEFVEQMEE